MALPDDIKATIRVACIGTNVTIDTALKPGQIVGGRTLIEEDLIGLVAQSNASQNGLYRSKPVPERDANYSAIKHGVKGAYDLFPGMMVSDEQTSKVYRCTSQRGGTLDVDAIVFEVMPSQADLTDIQNDITNIVAGVGLAVPVGVIMAYGGGTVPAQWLYCNGAAISRSTYSALFTSLSTAWGAGNGSTTFNLPDLRGRGIAGYDNAGTGRLAGRVNGVNAGVFASAGGLDYEYITTPNLPAHAHSIAAVTNSVGGENVDHAHQTYANTGYISADHSHSFQYSTPSVQGSGGQAVSKNDGSGNTETTGGVSANHYHLLDSWSGGRNTGHVHGVTTPAHNTNNAGGGGYINTVQPTAICMYIIYAGV